MSEQDENKQRRLKVKKKIYPSYQSSRKMIEYNIDRYVKNMVLHDNISSHKILRFAFLEGPSELV